MKKFLFSVILLSILKYSNAQEIISLELRSNFKVSSSVYSTMNWETSGISVSDNTTVKQYMALECPPPTRNHFLKVCDSINGRFDGRPNSGFSYQYQEDLWLMSCAKPGVDTPEEANEKIRKMWNQNKEKFKCEYSLVSVPDGNVLKFAMEANFSTFIVHAIKKYKLDMNFIDPVDKRTILDFVDMKYKEYASSPAYKNTADEYKRIYDLLINYGAKHAKDL